MFNFNQNNLKNANLFAAGLALGTVGLKVLTSKDAKKVYAGIVAAGLRAKETVLETAEKVQASASDVLAEAQEINEARNEEIFEEKNNRRIQLCYNFLLYENLEIACMLR